jgi:hypothetical protein
MFKEYFGDILLINITRVLALDVKKDNVIYPYDYINNYNFVCDLKCTNIFYVFQEPF